MTFFNPTDMQGQHPTKTRASVQLGDHDDVVRVHSVADTYSPPLHTCSFLEQVQAEPNQTVRRTLLLTETAHGFTKVSCPTTWQ